MWKPGSTELKATWAASRENTPGPERSRTPKALPRTWAWSTSRTLSNEDLNRMAGSSLDRDVLRSFRNADLVIEADDRTDTRFIAMEISFTADQRDCSRATRNAELITQFTGKPALAAVASVRNDQAAANRGGIRRRVLAPAGRPDSGPGVTRRKQTQSPEPNTPRRSKAWVFYFQPAMERNPSTLKHRGPG